MVERHRREPQPVRGQTDDVRLKLWNISRMAEGTAGRLLLEANAQNALLNRTKSPGLLSQIRGLTYAGGEYIFIRYSKCVSLINEDMRLLTDCS